MLADVGLEPLPGAERDEGVDAQPEPPLRLRPAIGGQVGPAAEAAHVVHLRHPQREGVRHRALKGLVAFFLRRIGNDAGHQRHRRVLEDAGRFAGFGISDDGAALRIGRLAREAGQRQGFRIGQRHVAVEPADKDGMRRGEAIDPAPPRQRAAPALVVPIAPEDPPAFRDRGGKGPEAPGKLAGRIGVAEFDAGQLEATAEEMCVVIDKARHHETTAEIDQARASLPQSLHAGRRPYIEQRAFEDGQRLSPRLLAGARPDQAVRVDDLGRLGENGAHGH